MTTLVISRVQSPGKPLLQQVAITLYYYALRHQSRTFSTGYFVPAAEYRLLSTSWSDLKVDLSRYDLVVFTLYKN